MGGTPRPALMAWRRDPLAVLTLTTLASAALLGAGYRDARSVGGTFPGVALLAAIGYIRTFTGRRD